MVFHHYRTLFKRHRPQMESNEATHAFIKEHYTDARVGKYRSRRWELKQGRQKTAGDFKSRYDIIENVEQLPDYEQDEEYWQEVERSS